MALGTLLYRVRYGFWETLGRSLVPAFELLGSLFPRRAPPAARPDSGITVVIHGPGSASSLSNTLQAAQAAVDALKLTCQWMVLEDSDGESTEYSRLPGGLEIEWISSGDPAGQAVSLERAVNQARYRWCLLLSRDTRIAADALSEVWPQRGTDVFSLCCQLLLDTGKGAKALGLDDYVAADWGLWQLQLPAQRSGFCREVLLMHAHATLFQSHWLSRFLEDNWIHGPAIGTPQDWALQASGKGLISLHCGAAEALLPAAMANKAGPDSEEHVLIVKNLEQCALRHRIAGSQAGKGVFLGRPSPGRRCLSMLRFARNRAQRPAAIDQPLAQADFHTWHLRPAAGRDHLPWVIWVSPYAIYPPTHGGARRIFELSKAISKHFRLALICDEGWALSPLQFDELRHIDELHLQFRQHSRSRTDRSLERIKQHSQHYLAAQLDRCLQRLQPALVELQYEELLGLVREPANSERWVVCLHDVNLEQQQQTDTDRYVLSQCEKLDGVIVCSRDDRAMIRHPGLELIDNGANLTDFASSEPSQGTTLVFVGSFRYQPNCSGIQQFLEQAWPRLKARYPDLELKIANGDVGLEAIDRPELFKSPGVSLLGPVMDIPALLRNATLVINPLFKVRGSCVKTIEALASGRICISTRDSIRGYGHMEFPALVVCDTLDEMAHQIMEFLDQPDKRHAGETVDHNMLTAFDWGQLGEQQARYYQHLMQNTARRRAAS